MAESYEILSGNCLVAVWKNETLEVLNDTLLPLYLRYHSDADMWLQTRAIDGHRANSRLLKKALRLADKGDIAAAMQANGATITDNYWIREIGSKIKYEDVAFDSEYFNSIRAKASANIALSGRSSSFNYVAMRTVMPTVELTNIGSFEKCWKNMDGKWWMFKRATRNEMFSEVFIYNLCRRIGINCAVYEKYESCVRTADFTDNGGVNFEPAFSFMNEEEDYELNIRKLTEICEAAVPDYVRMIFLDALVFNPDRHTANYGLIRDAETGELLSLAPCFDHNMALISNGYPNKVVRKDLLINLFCEVMDYHPEFRMYIPQVEEADVRSAIGETGMRVREDSITEYIMTRYKMLCE